MFHDTSIDHVATIALRGETICAITTKRSHRWIVPKGHLKRSGPLQTAIDEAWEEAGIRGELYSQPLGVFSMDKSGQSVETLAFLMIVSHVAVEWPERRDRERCWFNLTEFRQHIDEPELPFMARRAFRMVSIPWRPQQPLAVHLL